MSRQADHIDRPPVRRTLTRRRALLGGCAASFAAASGAAEVRYRKLKNPVVLPLSEVSETWRPVRFDALCGSTARPGSDVLLKGILLRLPDGLQAFSLNCPHELCHVSFVADTESVRMDGAAKPDHPLLVCPCHFSVFNPMADGAQITGPAGRGLYRFRLAVGRSRVEVTEVEEEALV